MYVKKTSARALARFTATNPSKLSPKIASILLRKRFPFLLNERLLEKPDHNHLDRYKQKGKKYTVLKRAGLEENLEQSLKSDPYFVFSSWKGNTKEMRIGDMDHQWGKKYKN